MAQAKCPPLVGGSPRPLRIGTPALSDWWYGCVIAALAEALMVVITSAQMRIFDELAMRRFEDAMLDRLAEPFDRQMRWLGREPMREVVRLGVNRVDTYGIEGDDTIFTYLCLMLMLGAFFDEDPQLPWAGAALLAPGVGSTERVEKVYALAMDYLDRVAGAENEHLVRALCRLRKLDPSTIDAIPREDRLEALAVILSRLYPEKAEAQTPEATRATLTQAMATAEVHGLSGGLGASLCAGLAFMVGAGFAADPQMPWVARTLAAPLAEAEKTARLHREIMGFLAFGLGELGEVG
jgi:hypothetical protein